MDRDGSGGIDATELRELGALLRAGWDADANATLLALIDEDRSGTVDLAEFRVCVPLRAAYHR